MYECPNCAANLKFDIKRQQLFCEACETALDPYSVEKDTDAEEREDFEATVYLCPQCGSKILSDDTTVATFCSYCGASTILTSRIAKYKKPKYIIPFQKTTEDCKSAYKEMVKGAFFAPKEFQDLDALKQFRAIYMPYWICNVEAKGKITFEGVSTAQRGNYKITKYTDFTTNIRSKYEGFTFDASEGFSDQLSALIAPFHMEEKKPFTASFLSGFYADSNDYNAAEYCEMSKNLAINHSWEKFSSQYPNYRFGESEEGTSLKDALDIQNVQEELALLPVWFLSYRKKDRVAYGVINGQTGKIALELPIDIKKFVGISLLIAIPIIILLNLFITIKPNVLLVLVTVLLSLFGLLINERTSQVLHKLFYEDFQLVTEDVIDKYDQQKSQAKMIDKVLLIIGQNLPFLLQTVLIIIAYSLMGVDCFAWLNPSVLSVITDIIFLTILGVKIYKDYRIEDVSYYNEEEYKNQWKKKMLYFVKPLIAKLFAIIVIMIDPVNDIIYYAAAIISMGLMFWTMFDLLKIENELLTHPLPQFNTRGGDVDAHKLL